MLDQTALRDAYRDQNWPEVKRLVTAEAIRVHAAVARAEMFTRYLRHDGFELVKKKRCYRARSK